MKISIEKRKDGLLLKIYDDGNHLKHVETVPKIETNGLIMEMLSALNSVVICKNEWERGLYEEDNPKEEKMYDAALRYELGGRIAASRQFAGKPSHFNRAEIVFEKVIVANHRYWKLKSWTNVAKYYDLLYEYTDEPPAFYEREGTNAITLKISCPHSKDGKRTVEIGKGDMLNQKEFVMVAETVSKAGERLNNIMEEKRDIANHKGEERITI